MNTTDLLGSLLEPINVERERLEAVKETLREQMADVDSQLRSLNRVLNAAEPKDQTAKKKGNMGRPKGSTLTPTEREARERKNQEFRQGILNIVQKVAKKNPEFNSRDLVATGMSDAQAMKAIQVLRESGEIRFVGNRPNPSSDPRINKPVKAYVLVND